VNPAIKYVLSHPRPTQVEAFAEIADQLTDREYWRLAGHIWIHGAACYFYAAQWVKIFQSPRPHRSHFAKVPADRLRWEKLPDEITIYRGCGDDNMHGVFFSLDREHAVLYAALLHYADAMIITFQCAKAFCIFSGGTYQEVIYCPFLKLSRYLKCHEGSLHESLQER
jgi:hypothetical protein